MTRSLNNIGRLCSLAAFLSSAAVFLGAGFAAAAVGPELRIDSLSSTSVAPGGTQEYLVQVEDVGKQSVSGEVVLTGTLPAGMSAVDGEFVAHPYNLDVNPPFHCTAGDGVSPIAGAADFRCEHSEGIQPVSSGGKIFQYLRLTVEVEPSAAEGVLTPTFAVSAGGVSAITGDPTLIAASPPGFGIEALDSQLLYAAGVPSTQAGGHPADVLTSLDFTTYTNPAPVLGGVAWPAEPAKDAVVDLPPGALGNPAGLDRCSAAHLANSSVSEPRPLCPTSSQIGTVLLRVNLLPFNPPFFGRLPVFNLYPPPGVAARFGFNAFGTVVVLDASLRSEADYGVSVASRNTSETLGIAGASFDFWGVPSDESHDVERACPGESNPWERGPTCDGAPEEAAFFRNPTSCQGPQATVAHVDSWFHPGAFATSGAPDLTDPNWKSATSLSHKAPGYPYAPDEWGEEQGFEGCSEEPFDPSLSGAPPAGVRAGQPTSFSFDLSMPQEGFEDSAAISESDLRKAVVILPPGIRVNPASADGLGACSPAQIGMTTAVGDQHPHFTNDAGNCPEDSKIGSLHIETPVLDHEIPGAVYLATPQQNPFGSLLALYFVAHDPVSGVNVKQAVQVEADPNTGQITTIVREIPQLPFTNLHIDLKDGPRGALVAPSTCGNYAIHSNLTGWSGAQVSKDSTFTISDGCAPRGFSPKLSAGTQNPLGGSHSPFSLRLTREDGTQELDSISATLPPGLAATFKGIPYCPDSTLASVSGDLGTGAAQIASPSCPAASQVGTVTVGAGAGTNPFYTASGRVYLAGPYKGAPLSLAVVTSAVAGPFDLGSVVVRNALYVDPTTAQGRAVSDPLPHILHGIPLDLRDVRVNLDRPDFTLNPTSCDPMAITSTITSTQGAAATPSNHFQAAGCDRLRFKPKLSLALFGPSHRSAHPKLRAVLRMPSGGANIARAAVTLPKTEFLENAHIRTICTRVQYAADTCPAGSVYGYAKAWTPLLDKPLEGPVYLRSSSHTLPDLVASLDGQIHIDLVGKIDTANARIRNTFELVPDAPVSKFVLTMQGGKKGLLANNIDICKGEPHATALFDGQNGKVHDIYPAVRRDCAARKHGHKR